MKLKQLLKEEQTANDIIKIIKKDCAYFLKESNYDMISYSSNPSNKGLWKGAKSFADDFFKRPVRQNRRPLKANKEFFRGVDESMKKDGFKAIRSNSIICTPDLGTAYAYGEPYAIFPIGKFNYTWSYNIYDYLIQYWDKYNVDSGKEGNYEDGARWWNEIKNEYENNKKLNQAVLADSEILINAKEVYYLSEYSDVSKEVLEKLKR